MFERIFIEKGIEDRRIPEFVNQAFPGQIIEEVASVQEIYPLLDESSSSTRIQSGKKILFLTRYKGKLIKFCPARSPECYLCCNLHTINLMANCVYNCIYCILQSCLSNPLMQVFCNMDEICSELAEFDRQVQAPTRICTGEIADSLALDPILRQSEILVCQFREFKNLFLELKTKSDQVDHLLSLDPAGKTILSFSINPEPLVKKVELHTASLQDRLKAARKVLDAGYQVAFNLDPVIYYKGYQNDYLQLFQALDEQFDPAEISFMHVGLLRYTPGLAGIARERFPGSEIFDQEFVVGPDKKYRYPKPVRDEMYGFLYQNLKQWDPDLPSYACVEKADHWKKFQSMKPGNVLEVQDYVMQRVGRANREN